MGTIFSADVDDGTFFLAVAEIVVVTEEMLLAIAVFQTSLAILTGRTVRAPAVDVRFFSVQDPIVAGRAGSGVGGIGTRIVVMVGMDVVRTGVGTVGAIRRDRIVEVTAGEPDEADDDSAKGRHKGE